MYKINLMKLTYKLYENYHKNLLFLLVFWFEDIKQADVDSAQTGLSGGQGERAAQGVPHLAPISYCSLGHWQLEHLAGLFTYCPNWLRF